MVSWIIVIALTLTPVVFVLLVWRMYLRVHAGGSVFEKLAKTQGGHYFADDVFKVCEKTQGLGFNPRKAKKNPIRYVVAGRAKQCLWYPFYSLSNRGYSVIAFEGRQFYPHPILVHVKTDVPPPHPELKLIQDAVTNNHFLENLRLYSTDKYYARSKADDRIQILLANALPNRKKPFRVELNNHLISVYTPGKVDDEQLSFMYQLAADITKIAQSELL